MLVEDDTDDQQIFMLALEEIDPMLKCRMVNSCHSAIETLTANPVLPQLIFLDLNLPRINGKECLSRIKQHPALQNIPIVIYSTSDNYRDKVETKNLGAHAFITKPSSLDELVITLRPYLLNAVL